MAYVRKVDSIEDVTRDVAAGNRKLFFGNQNNTEVNAFLKQLENRARSLTDEDTEPIQAPVYIGCSTSIEAGSRVCWNTPRYSPQATLS